MDIYWAVLARCWFSHNKPTTVCPGKGSPYTSCMLVICHDNSYGANPLGADSSHGGLFDPVGQLRDLVEEALALCQVLADPSLGIHHGGVVAATEVLADLRQ